MSASDRDGFDLFLRNWHLTEGYTIVCLFATQARDLDQARALIQAECPELERFAVSDSGLARFGELVQNHQGSKRRAVWFQQPDFDPAGWREILPRFNLHRDSIGRKAPIFLVLAGPPDLEDLLMRCAGDLYDVADHRELKSPQEHTQSDPGPTYRKLLYEHFSSAPINASEFKLRQDPKGGNINREITLEQQLKLMRRGKPFRGIVEGPVRVVLESP